MSYSLIPIYYVFMEQFISLFWLTFMFRTIYSAGLKSHQVITMANGNQLNLYSRPGQIFTVLQCWSVLYYTTTYMYCTVQYCTALPCTVLTDVMYCTVLYCTVLYCNVLYCNVLYTYCTVFYAQNSCYCLKNYLCLLIFEI